MLEAIVRLLFKSNFPTYEKSPQQWGFFVMFGLEPDISFRFPCQARE